MRMLWLFAVLLLSSCAAEQFSVSSLSMDMEREIVISEAASESNTLSVSAVFSSPDNSYTFRIVSPDGDLVWEGAFSGSGSDKTSETLEITPGAVFPQGEYSLLIYSDNGTEVEESLSLDYDEGIRHFENGLLSGSAYVRELDEAGNIISEGSRSRGYEILQDTVTAEIDYQDSYGQSVSVTEFFQPSASDPSPSAL